MGEIFSGYRTKVLSSGVGRSGENLILENAADIKKFDCHKKFKLISRTTMFTIFNRFLNCSNDESKRN